ncbi:MAG: DNA topoisomerase IV [Flavobacteriaceae bacterium]
MRIVVLSALLLLFTGCFSPDRNCKDFQTGTFSFTSIVLGDTLTTKFIRTDSIEVDYYLNRVDSSSVRWLNDCECIVKKMRPLSYQESKAVHMKILTTKDNTYTFEYNLVGDSANKQRGVVTKLSN